MTESQPASDAESDWLRNYFNYFTEIEEHFQKARGTGLFLMSPLDWALIENWKSSGIPLEAVLKGIDEAFEKWHSRNQKRRMVNSVAYCAQAVLEAAQRAPANRQNAIGNEAPFAVDELRDHLAKSAAAIRRQTEPPFVEVAASLDLLAQNVENHLGKLEELEQRLTVLEEKLVSAIRMLQTDRDLYAMREALDRELKPYRGKMTADQISMLERRYLDTALLERAQMPRLSLFYLH